MTGKVTANAEYPNLKGGSRKGVPNKVNGDVKAMILAALDKAGGPDYLLAQAEANPNAFLTLVGKVLPMTVQGPGEGGEFTFTVLERRIVKPE